MASERKPPDHRSYTTFGNISARYDNSLKNRYNPAPDGEVYWAEQSWDEMFIPHMEYAIDSKVRKEGRSD